MTEEYCYPFNRKKLSDYYEMLWRCAKCGYCRNVFPSDTEDERFGRQCPPGERFRFESYYTSGRNEITRRIIEGKQELTPRLRHILYTCTTCNACEEWCEVTQGLNPLKIINALRKYYVEHGGELLPGHKKIIKSIRQNHNRLNRNNRDRLGWLGYLPSKNTEKADVTYFIGCRSSFRRTEIARNAHELLTKKLGINVNFLEDERCCGRPLLEIGAEKEALELMKHNLEKIKKTGAETIIFTCAECFSLFSDIDRYGFEKDFETIHISQYLAKTIKEKGISFSEMQKKVAFHDPCYLGRHQGVYDDPRDVITSIPGTELVEMPRNRKNAWCCGAGGVVKEGYLEYSHWIAEERFQEINKTGAEMLVTSCPGCKESLWGKASAANVEILDLAELVNRQIKG